MGFPINDKGLTSYDYQLLQWGGQLQWCMHGMKIYNLVRLPEGETLTESTNLPISN